MGILIIGQWLFQPDCGKAALMSDWIAHSDSGAPILGSV